MNITPACPRRFETRSLAAWFFISVLIVTSFQAAGVWGHGGGNWGWLLHVGTAHPLRSRIENELGPVASENGHDGQFFYAIARDPIGRRGTPELLKADNPWYRYRRILYPLLAGGFGLFGPKTTLYGLIFWSWVGFGLMGAATADICDQLCIEKIFLLSSIFNPGILFSGVLLTSDVLGLGLGLTGLTLWLRRWRSSSILFLALSALARETLILIAWSIALVAWQQRRPKEAVAVAVLPLMPVMAWSAVTWVLLPDSGAALHHFSFPGLGILMSVQEWCTMEDSFGHIAFGAIGIGMIVAAFALIPVCRNKYVMWGMVTWGFLGLLSSRWVWMFPENAVRAIAPLWAFLLLCVGGWRAKPA
jgi:hypothetical protein